MSELLKVIGAILALIIPFALGAVSGALGMATTALIVAGGAYLIGFLTMGTAQAVALWMTAGGALLGGVIWTFVALAGAAGAS